MELHPDMQAIDHLGQEINCAYITFGILGQQHSMNTVTATNIGNQFSTESLSIISLFNDEDVKS